MRDYKEYEIDVDVRERAGQFLASPLIRRMLGDDPEGLEFPPVGVFATAEEAEIAGYAWARDFIDLNW